MACFTENSIYFNLKSFLLKSRSDYFVTPASLCVTFIVSPAYSQLNNFPKHLDARKGMRVTYWFGGCVSYTRISIPESMRATLFRQWEHQRTPPPFLLSSSVAKGRRAERKGKKVHIICFSLRRISILSEI